MPHTEQQVVIRKEIILVFVDVEVSAVVYGVAVLLEPTDERDVPMREGLAW
jgi:hypothetical protein